MKKVLKLLILSDIFLVTGFGLINPILAIFIKDNLIGGSVAAVGIATTILLLVKSLSQLVVSKHFEQKDRIWLLVSGTFLLVPVPIIYAFSTNIWHIYLAQVLHGISAGMAVPTFIGLLILNINHKKPGLEWSIYSTWVSVGTAIAAYIGAVLATVIGFKMVFFLTGFLSLIGALILITLTKQRFRRK